MLLLVTKYINYWLIVIWKLSEKNSAEINSKMEIRLDSDRPIVSTLIEDFPIMKTKVHDITKRAIYDQVSQHTRHKLF